MSEWAEKIFSADFVTGHLLPAAALTVAAFVVGRVAGRIARRIAHRVPSADASVESIVSGVVSWSVAVVCFVAALDALGVDTGGVMAALGGVALAIGLGLRETLGNVAAGLTILVLRPFHAGEFVTFAGSGDARSSGTVVKIGLFATELRTVEGVFLSVPNRLLVQEPIANFGRNPERMVRLVFSISYSDSIDTGLRVLLQLGADEPRRLPEKPAEAFVEALGESSVDLSLRVWVRTEDYWPVRRALLKAGKEALEKAGLVIPFPQRDVHLYPAAQSREIC